MERRSPCPSALARQVIPGSDRVVGRRREVSLTGQSTNSGRPRSSWSRNTSNECSANNRTNKAVVPAGSGRPRSTPLISTPKAFLSTPTSIFRPAPRNQPAGVLTRVVMAVPVCSRSYGRPPNVIANRSRRSDPPSTAPTPWPWAPESPAPRFHQARFEQPCRRRSPQPTHPLPRRWPSRRATLGSDGGKGEGQSAFHPRPRSLTHTSPGNVSLW